MRISDWSSDVCSSDLCCAYAAIVLFGVTEIARRAEVTEGALVSASQGTLLTTIEQIDRVYVNFGQSSSDLLAIRGDMGSGKVSVPQLERVEVQLILEDGSAYPVIGHLDFLDLSIDEDRTSVVSGKSVDVRVSQG